MGQGNPGTGGAERCTLCSEPPVIRLPEPDRHLCAAHLIADIEERAARTIRKRELIKPQDRIAVAFSGGKDSLPTLLHLLSLGVPAIVPKNEANGSF